MKKIKNLQEYIFLKKIGYPGGVDRGRVRDVEADLRADARERAKVRRQRDPDGRHAIVCTSTDSTAGRCSTIGRHESPESGDA